MLWTEESIEVLKRLALEGRSASVIAAALGAASRNAVIGKANRIGVRLKGHGRAAMPAGMQAGMHRAQWASIVRRAPAASGQSASPALSRAPSRMTGWMFAEAEVGDMRRVGFGEIHEFVCRWPLGDPAGADFAYCGLEAANGRSYCAGHCRMAYQPPKARAGRDRQERPRCARAVANLRRLC
jgi:GcrA cell cycle regulator